MRDELNKHLTTNVILRIDYVPLSDEKVDNINNILAKMFLVDNTLFDDMKQTFVRNIDIQMNDPSIQDFNEFINIKEKSKIKSYEYLKNNGDNVEMKATFNRQFCSIDINQNVKYYNYESYRDIFEQILMVLKEQEIIINRFGLRKFNNFFIKNEANYNEYVKDKYFNLNCSDLLQDSESLISEKRYNFLKKSCNVNLITHCSIGNMDNELVRRIAFDIDIFETDVKNLQQLFSDNSENYINEKNDELFNVYFNLLEDKMKILLNRENELNDNNIVYGVDYNEDI